MKIHPYAELFPPITEEALKILADDIRTNGQKHPIWVQDGQILDGRNRWNACRLANVECQSIEYEGDDPLGFVISLNLHRRQLTASQLAMIGVEIEQVRAKEARERKVNKSKEQTSLRQRGVSGRFGPPSTQVTPNLGGPGRTNESARQVAREIGVSHGYISKAKQLARTAPELIPFVKAGLLKLTDATTFSQIPADRRSEVIGGLANVSDLRKAITTASTIPRTKPTSSTGDFWSEAEAIIYTDNYIEQLRKNFLSHTKESSDWLIARLNDFLGELTLINPECAHTSTHSVRRIA